MTVLERFRLDGRVAIVTGSARGLGLAAARALAQVGAHVVITSRDREAAEAAAAELSRSEGARALGLPLDVREPGSVSDLVARTLADLGRIDILVNNAGLTRRAPLATLTTAQWDEVVDTNLKGSWLCCQGVLLPMRKARWGRIVNVSSMLGQVGLPDRSPYSASKGGVTALTRALAVELAPDGITVNAIAPGPFLTGMHDAKARSAIIEQIPLGRWGEPAEIGPAVVFLASEASSFVTGATLAIDGGYTAR